MAEWLDNRPEHTLQHTNSPDVRLPPHVEHNEVVTAQRPQLWHCGRHTGRCHHSPPLPYYWHPHQYRRYPNYPWERSTEFQSDLGRHVDQDAINRHSRQHQDQMYPDINSEHDRQCHPDELDHDRHYHPDDDLDHGRHYHPDDDLDHGRHYHPDDDLDYSRHYHSDDLVHGRHYHSDDGLEYDMHYHSDDYIDHDRHYHPDDDLDHGRHYFPDDDLEHDRHYHSDHGRQYHPDDDIIDHSGHYHPDYNIDYGRHYHPDSNLGQTRHYHPDSNLGHVRHYQLHDHYGDLLDHVGHIPDAMIEETTERVSSQSQTDQQNSSYDNQLNMYHNCPNYLLQHGTSKDFVFHGLYLKQYMYKNNKSSQSGSIADNSQSDNHKFAHKFQGYRQGGSLLTNLSVVRPQSPFNFLSNPSFRMNVEGPRMTHQFAFQWLFNPWEVEIERRYNEHIFHHFFLRRTMIKVRSAIFSFL